MLNPDFSRKIKNVDLENYVLPSAIIQKVVQQNQNFDSGPELRLQKIYGDELWLKIKSLGLKESDFENKKILDICCGTGFLSRHLLEKIKPRELTLLDISAKEISEAKKLLARSHPGVRINYITADFLNAEFPGRFDVIIGNSFLHHFYNMPLALKSIYNLLENGGVFISLHEPTIASIAFESRNPKNYLSYLIKGKSYLDFISDKGLKKYPDELVRPGGGGDVWVFQPAEFKKLFQKTGFVKVKTAYWHFLRPIVVAIASLHLSPQKPRLNFFEKFFQESAIICDSILRHILPAQFFASVAIKAEK